MTPHKPGMLALHSRASYRASKHQGLKETLVAGMRGAHLKAVPVGVGPRQQQPILADAVAGVLLHCLTLAGPLALQERRLLKHLWQA